MSDIKIQPSATGSATVTLTAPVTNTARTITFPDSTSTLLASDGSGASLTGINSFTGDTTITSGDLLFGTAGKGVVLGATTNVDANTLDDYEEGVWTPAISGTSSTSGQSYDTQTGQYTKIGNKVFCSFNIDLSAKGTISGFLKITGFPFAVSGNNAASFSYTSQWYLTADHHLQGTVYGTNILYLFECSQQADVPSQLSTSALVDSTICVGSFFFTTTD